jgi:S-adenosylmethionine hydrolase
MRATVLYVDQFGNIQLNLTRRDLDRAGIEPGARIELELGADRYYAVAARTFADVRRGDIMLYEDAYQNIAVAISGGDAASMLQARPGRTLLISFRP